MIGKKLDWVRVCNFTSEPQALIDKKGLPGPLKFAPHEIKDVPAQVWGRKFQLAWARRAGTEDEERWTAIQAGVVAEVQEGDGIVELEETRLDALQARGAELGVKLKGSKAVCIVQLRCALARQLVVDLNAALLELVAQGAYEADRAARLKVDPKAEIASWKEASDEDRKVAIQAAQLLMVDDLPEAESTPFNEAALSIIAASKDIQPVEAEEGADN